MQVNWWQLSLELKQIESAKIKLLARLENVIVLAELGILLIAPSLPWCLVDLRGHVTDGKT